MRLEPRDPQVPRDHAGNRVGRGELLRMTLDELLEGRPPPPKLVGLGLQLIDLTDRHLELLELLLAHGDLGGKSPPLVGEQQPVGGDPDDRDHVDEAEEHAQVEARQAERGEAGEAEAPPPLCLGREIDPDHSSLSPGRLSPSPTATASAGPAALTSSPYAGPTSTLANGRASTTGMPQFDAR